MGQVLLVKTFIIASSIFDNEDDIFTFSHVRKSSASRENKLQTK